MEWPQGPLPQRVEIWTGEQWEDITADVRTREATTIARGRPDEATVADPGSCSFQLNNGTSNVNGIVGRYSPRNPRSDLYEVIGRNTPVRVSVRAGAPYLMVPESATLDAAVSAPLATPTTALDVRVELALPRMPGQAPASSPTPFVSDWTEIIGQYVPAVGQRSWFLAVNGVGGLSLRWSTDGTNAPGSVVTAQGATASAPYASGERWALRLVAVWSGGAWTTTAYHAPTLEGPWREMGQLTGTGAPPFASTVPIRVGAVASMGVLPHGARHYRAEVRHAIDGAPVAAPDWTTASPGDTALTDAQGVDWVLVGDAEVTDWYPRWAGEIPAWPPRWDLSEADVWTPVRAAGILRRLGQGARPLQSTLRRKIPSYGPALLAYWPMEDGADAAEAASAMPNSPAMTAIGLDFAANSDLPSSAPLPTVTDGARIVAPLPPLPAGSPGWRFEMVYYLDTLPSTETVLIALDVAGDGIARVTLGISSSSLQFRWYDGDGAQVDAMGTSNSAILEWWRSGWCRLYITATPSGGTTTWRVMSTPVGETAEWGLQDGVAFYAVPRRIATTWASTAAGLPIGHITYTNTPTGNPYGGGVGGADNGWRGETSVARLRRLAQEEQLPVTTAGWGTALEYTRLGPQRIATMMDLMRDAAEADGGLLGEVRDDIALSYMPRTSMLNRRPALELDYAVGHIAPDLLPEDDDQQVRNDITVTRTSGSSARAVLEEGPLSVQPPPAGIGVYDEAVDVNVMADSQLPDIAAWRLHLATIDEVRYPVVRLNLRNPRMAEHIQAYLDRVDVGARITISNPPPWLPPEPIDLIVQSYTETIGQFEWDVELTCTPASPWRVGEVAPNDPDEARPAPVHVDTDGTTLAVPVNESATVLYLWSNPGPEWVTSGGPAGGTAADGDLPVDLALGGEVVRASRIEPVGWDAFDRTLSGGWGTTTTGLTWLANSGPAGDRSVSAGEGIITLTSSPTTPRFMLLSPPNFDDAELLVNIAPSQLATGAALAAGVIMRVAGTAYYRVRALLGTDGTVGLDAARASTVIGAVASTPYTYTGGTVLRLRVRLEGHRIRAKVWTAASVLEPDAWQLDRTVETDPVPVGLVGVVAMGESGNTNSSPQIRFSAWQVVGPQYVEVERSINGVAKSHPASVVVRLADPMIVAR
ncbi:hypothetical protein FH609_004100 [Streptomyces sp. 3MP-14]|nr:hypothetical protein [Streptomyces mimosae]KAB8179130.1 hypothetical protein FH609_004100 [Streptomyces sp. 3MP-14]